MPELVSNHTLPGRQVGSTAPGSLLGRNGAATPLPETAFRGPEGGPEHRSRSMKNRRSLRRACAAVLLGLLAGVAAHADPKPGQGTWETVLQPRDLNGDGVADAWYDSSRNLSWAADADPIGANDWPTTQAWVSGLSLYGVTGWRLPTVQAVAGGLPACPMYTYDGSGDCGFNVNPALSELAHMYQVVLGNIPAYDTAGVEVPVGWGLSNTGPFLNLRAGDYPTSVTVPGVFDGVPGLGVWLFETTYGYQDGGEAMVASHHAWAVHDGDVSAVPEPHAWALMLAGLGLLARRLRSRG